MMAAERDSCIFLNVARIEAAIAAGNSFTIGDSRVPVVDGSKAANADPKTALTCYVPVPKNPHGVNVSPDGKYRTEEHTTEMQSLMRSSYAVLCLKKKTKFNSN